MTTDIKEWDFKTLPKYPVIVNVSKRRGGKTFLTRDLVRNHFWANRKVKNILVISETALFNGDYYFLSKTRIVKSFNNDLINSIFERQKQLIASDPKGDNELLLILDDVINMEDSGRNNVKLLGRLFSLSRHFATSIILNVQYIKSDVFPPLMRDNSDVICVFLQTNKDNKKMINNTWLSINDNDSEGYNLIDTIPNSNHRILIIDNTKITNNYNDFVFHYTAQPIPKTFKYKFNS